MRKLSGYPVCSVCLFFIILISGCGLGQATNSSQPPNAITRNLYPTSSSTITPTLYNTPLSPFSTISTNEAESLVRGLLENNANCLLPCWWGITPGKTSWAETERYFKTFALSIGDAVISNNNNYQRITIFFPTPVDIFTQLYIEQEYWIHNGVIIAIASTNYGAEPIPAPRKNLLSLDTVLNTYGQPDEITLYTYAYDGGVKGRPTGVILFYNQGILIKYSGARYVTDIDGHTMICPSSYDRYVAVWDPRLNFTYKMVTELFGFSDEPPYPRQLQDVSSMNIADFYQTYLNPDTTTCIDTLQAAWPNP